MLFPSPLVRELTDCSAEIMSTDKITFLMNWYFIPYC